MDLKERGSIEREESDPLGIYVHVPFCSTACDFCAFYQVQSDRQGILDYIEGIRRELALVDIGNRKIDTMFWGGGTPGLLKAEDMERVAMAVLQKTGQPRREWTVEMAPSSVKRDKLQMLKDLGVTRISMGAQSLDEGLLEALGRQHSRKQILNAYDLIREVGFRSVNIDLIFAIPTQSEEDWRNDVREVCGLQPDHLSTYCLTFEEDTALFVKLQQGKVSLDPEREIRFYEAIWEESANAGFQQYEISNYAKPGHECVHNVNTWRMREWIGLGPSGSSQFSGSRHTNTPDLKKWLEGIGLGERGQVDRMETNSDLLMEDALIFGLRMNEGVDLLELEKRFSRPFRDSEKANFQQLVEEGRATCDDGRLRLTREGRLVADAVGEMLLGTLTTEGR